VYATRYPEQQEILVASKTLSDREKRMSVPWLCYSACLVHKIVW
jgi:hypothetical protein